MAAIFNGKDFFSVLSSSVVAVEIATNLCMPTYEIEPLLVTANGIGSENFLVSVSSQTAHAAQVLYRGIDDITFLPVYSIGSPPAGCHNIVVVNSGESSY